MICPYYGFEKGSVSLLSKVTAPDKVMTIEACGVVSRSTNGALLTPFFFSRLKDDHFL